ncbi:MAG: Rpn family recombination-promoting nuclease/putative transposase [Clostridia bacterium]|nr:Rpn family recombination-promoting nuclease/putative transposase [Clostridia bacterium]
MDKKLELLPLTNDFVFKRVFTKDGNEDLLKDFLTAILDIEIKEIEIKNPEMTKENKEAKLEILDIRAKANNNMLINIEMQVRDYKDIGKRSMAYTSKVYSDQLKIGDQYKDTYKTIAINILNFNFYNRNTYHSISRMKFEKIEKEKYVNMGYEREEEYATKDIEIHYIELPKFLKKNPGVGSKLEQWLWLICGEGEKADMAKKKNEEVKKASEVLETISQDEKEQMRYLSRLMKQMDEESYYAYARKEGEKQAKLQTAKKLLKKGIDIEIIIETTGLTKQEILNS